MRQRATCLRPWAYRSDHVRSLTPNTAATFQAAFDPHDELQPDKALLGQWHSVDMLGQVTGEEIGAALRGQAGLFRAEGWESGNLQLCSPEASLVTATALAVDGGYLAI